MREIGACFGHGLADLGAHFDLALEELRADLACKFRGAFGHKDFRARQQIEALAVDKQVFLFHAEGEAGFR
jgi:hypothetical protein